NFTPLMQVGDLCYSNRATINYRTVCFRERRMKYRVMFGLLAACVFTSAQDITGTIVGTVTDPSGAGVPGAKVTVTNTDRNAVIRNTETHTDGNYSAPLLPIGHYTVTVEAKGFKKTTTGAIELNVNDRLTVNVKIEVGDVSSEITVESSAVQVEM